MSKLVLELRQDQANDIKALVNREMKRLGYSPAYCVGLLQIIEDAEKAAALVDMSAQEWFKTHPHWRCGTVHDGIECPRGGNTDYYY